MCVTLLLMLLCETISSSSSLTCDVRIHFIFIKDNIHTGWLRLIINRNYKTNWDLIKMQLWNCVWMSVRDWNRKFYYTTGLIKIRITHKSLPVQHPFFFSLSHLSRLVDSVRFFCDWIINESLPITMCVYGMDVINFNWFNACEHDLSFI